MRFFSGAPWWARPASSRGLFIAAIAPPLLALEGEMRPGICYTRNVSVGDAVRGAGAQCGDPGDVACGAHAVGGSRIGGERAGGPEVCSGCKIVRTRQ